MPNNRCPARLLSGIFNPDARPLTSREDEIAKAVATGLTSKQIARALRISPRTVEKHRENAMRKLGARNLSQLIHLASALTATPPGRARARSTSTYSE